MKEIGGQAVIEGVMMRNKNKIATAVRLPNGRIKVKKQKLKPKHKFLKLFFIRGIVNLIEMIVLGIKELIWSSEQAIEKKEEKISKVEIIVTVAISVVFGLLFFMALPYILTNIIGIKEEVVPIIFNLVDGIIKIALFLGYIYVISLMKDIKRLFQYHGAEHKAVYCYENKKPLTVENTMKYTTLHPRCGTAFIMIVIIVSIILFSFIPLVAQLVYPDINSIHLFLRKLIFFISRLLLLPVVAGFSYEILKFGAKHQDNVLLRALTLPGLWIQKLTTKNPTKKQIGVAIRALENVLERKIYK